MPTGVVRISDIIHTLQPRTVTHAKGTEYEFEIGIVEWGQYEGHYLNVYRVPGGEWSFQQPYLDKGIRAAPDKPSSLRWPIDPMSDGDPLA